MAVIKATDKEVDLLARLMRAEAEVEGQLGMLMVGNVGVNRVRGDCLDFRNVPTREKHLRLARHTIAGERFHPATRSLWFFEPSGECPDQWYNQWNTGRYKEHCFFSPTEEDCPTV